MDEWLERQAPLDAAVANALIAATPEWWKVASPVADRGQEDSQERMTIVITSPDGQPEPVSPTEEIYVSLYALNDFFRERGTIWRSASYSVSQEEHGDWKYSVQFTY
ncbi:hypothetical protein [Variovorax ginsengisoli]|uniref:Uncharacterized protein n=1 Tax=Variovorax ginsengisoli TaxID=363844 RepID=A0ABT9S8L3_9BURK|nr:hypothetical protein [Variovorax ginsengisoli]MDP9899717.1 hypothetical protein [Variovorax ginsengisoli]